MCLRRSHKVEAVVNQTFLGKEESVKDLEVGEAQTAADQAVVRAGKPTEKEKIVACAHQDEEVAVVATVKGEKELIQDPSQILPLNQTVLGRIDKSDGSMTNMNRIDTISQGLTGPKETKETTQGIDIGIGIKEITEMKEIDIDKGTDKQKGEDHKLVECVDGKMKTMKLRTTNCSVGLVLLRPQLKKNQNKVQSLSAEEQRESQAKKEIIEESIIMNQLESLHMINGTMISSLLKKTAKLRNETVAQVVKQ